MDNSRKKELMKAYKTKPVIGGVCAIRCAGNGREWMQATTNIEGARHRYDFAVSIGSAPDPSMRAEWEEYGASSFSFEVLEELKKTELQTDKEFAADVDALYELWQEKRRTGGAN